METNEAPLDPSLMCIYVNTVIFIIVSSQYGISMLSMHVLCHNYFTNNITTECKNNY